MPTYPASSNALGASSLPDGTTQSGEQMIGRVLNLWDNLVAKGADPASNTDVSAAVQAEIDRIPTTGSSGVPAHTIYVPGHFRLDSQVNIYQKAVRFLGRGVGNPANFSTPGEGSGFRWAGAAGGNMFNVRDSQWCSWSDLYLQGNTTNVPASMIYFQSEGGSIGTNQQLFIDRCQIGSLPWTTPATSGGTSATVGVRFGGSQNGNNDQFHFTDVVWQRCATGLALDNSQSIWGVLTNPLFDNCATAGITTNAAMQIYNGTFSENLLDLNIADTARVVVNGFYSEVSTQLVKLTGQGHLAVYGGKTDNHAGMTPNTIDHQSCGFNGSLLLSGFRMNQAGLTHRKIKVRGVASGVGRGAVTILDSIGWDYADLDIANVGSGDPIDVNIASNGMKISQTLASAETLAYVIDATGTGSPEGVVTAAIGSQYHRRDGGVSTSLYIKTSGAGNTGWTAK